MLQMYCSSKFSPNYFLIYDIVFNVCKIVHMEAVLISPVYKYHHFGESSCGVLGILKSKQFTRDRKKKTYAFAINCKSVQFSSVQSLSCVQLFATPWIAARQASLSITDSWSLLKLISIELVMPSNHLILCCPLLLLPPIPPSIRVFPSESTLPMR